ncbi:MAG: hypothetical protein IIU57_01040 [Oscillospiraceae bacterium]|nr:hypothetical protein [Acidaminococcaceae bacterium]MBQ5356796.1 hypothetical protein [Oscillospiraceae bacterium]
MADGQVVFEIKGDPSNVNQTVKQVTNNIQQESKKWDQAASQATGDIEKSFASMAGKIVGTLAAAGIGSILLNWGKAALETASDLAEVQNVVDTVFGDGSRQIEAWSKKAGQQFGLTELQAKKFTSTLGAMMKSSGMASNEIITMSTDLAGLAADMASFYNLDFETAFEKIRSGISGETMPLKQLGINMSVANLEAFALAQGLEKTFSEMSQGEQTMLRYQYLMQATSDAQGDFAKTADGFANAQRRIQTALDSISAVAGTFILNTIEPLISGVARFLEKITTQPERTVLDDFNEINVDTTQKMADLEQTYQKAKDIINLLKEIGEQTVTLKDGSKISFEELFADIGNLEKNGGDVRGYLESLGVDVDYVIQKYNVWKESTRQLTSLVPGLTSVIDSETGAIEGGTDALEKNLNEWKAYQEKKIAWAAYYAKERALAEKKGEMYMYEFDAGAARQAAKRVQDNLEKQAISLGINLDWYEGDYSKSKIAGQTNVLTEEQRTYNETLAEYLELENKASAAEAELARQTVDYSEAEQQLADGKQALIDKYGEEEKAAEDAAEATEEGFEITKEGAEAAAKAVKALNDYYQGVLDSTQQAVNSTLKGFESINTVWDQQSDLANQETEALNKYTAVWAKWGSDNAALKKMKEYVDNGGKLTKTELEAYEALVKVRNAQKELNDSLDQYRPEGMTAGLNDQIAYMEEYLANLNTLSEWGVSPEMLASLSDGSKESAAYLKGLVEGGPEAAAAVGELYKQVEEKKASFTKALTDQKLAVDETYQGMVDTAMEAMGGLNLYDEAESSLASTVEGIAAGINESYPEVKAAVDQIVAELNRLNGLGFSFDFDGGGGIEFISVGPSVPLAVGADYIPYDNFPALLHEGEAVLTKEENAAWQAYKTGYHSNGVDYDVLGGLMRSNVKAGGDVYLEGRVVGQVISGIQGRNYRNLQRSGWQG